jgi:hypothetical protein
MSRQMVMVSTLVLAALCGCSGTVTTELDTGANDGCISILTRYVPQRFGQVLATVEPARVGVSVSGGGDTLLARTLFRLDCADWRRAGDMTLHLYCDAVSGQPDPVDVYITDDFGELVDVTQPEDVGAIWSVTDAGSLCGRVTPSAGQWSTVVVLDSLVQAHRSGAGRVCFAVRLVTEQTTADNWYRFATFERSAELGLAGPHLTWPKRQ